MTRQRLKTNYELELHHLQRHAVCSVLGWLGGGLGSAI